MTTQCPKCGNEFLIYDNYKSLRDNILHCESCGIYFSQPTEETVKLPNMSLRDWFIGQSLTGLTSKLQILDDKSIAHAAVSLADAVIKEREIKR